MDILFVMIFETFKLVIVAVDVLIALEVMIDVLRLLTFAFTVRIVPEFVMFVVLFVTELNVVAFNVSTFNVLIFVFRILVAFVLFPIYIELINVFAPMFKDASVIVFVSFVTLVSCTMTIRFNNVLNADVDVFVSTLDRGWLYCSTIVFTVLLSMELLK